MCGACSKHGGDNEPVGDRLHRGLRQRCEDNVKMDSVKIFL
jgi:hypothetical protein